MTDKLTIVNENPEGLFTLEQAELLLRAPETIAVLRTEDNGEVLASHVMSVPVKVIRDAFRIRPLCAVRPADSKARGTELYKLAEIEAAYRSAVAFATRK